MPVSRDTVADRRPTLTRDLLVPELATVPLFADVPDELLQLVTTDMVYRFPDNSPLFHQGAPGDSLVVLLRGQVRVAADGIFLVARRAYDVIGEQAFINDAPRTATAIAQGMVRALVLPRLVVQPLMADATFCRNLLRILSTKLAEATNERAYRFRHEQLLFSEFSAHVSPEVTQRLLEGGLAYGDPRYIDAVILFSDVRSFTASSAAMQAEDIAAQLGPYLDECVDVIHRHDGLVDKFVGDAVLAVWGFVPIEADLAVQAFTCATELVTVAAGMRFGDGPIAIGVGLNAGRVFIGNVGGEGKRQFTVLGTPVNMAARFESESKELGMPIVVGQALSERLPMDVQSQLTPHENRVLRGGDSQTLFTFDPRIINRERGQT